MVVVGVAVDLVHRDVELVGALDEIQAVDRERRLGVAEDPLALQLLEAGVGPVAAHPFGIEDADADDEVVDRERRAQPDPDRQRLARLEHVPALAVGRRQHDVGDLHLARSPPPFRRAEHVGRRLGGFDRMVRQHGGRRLVGRDHHRRLQRLGVRRRELRLPRAASTSVT